MKRWLFAAILATFVVAGWTQAPATGTANGSVTLNGVPLVGAAVVIASSGDSSFTVKVTTDASGNFSAASVPLGNVVAKAFDVQGNFLSSVTGTLTRAGDVVTLPIAATR